MSGDNAIGLVVSAVLLCYLLPGDYLAGIYTSDKDLRVER